MWVYGACLNILGKSQNDYFFETSYSWHDT
jgi:hypothetical protein